ncbi:MAG: amino acid permease [Candidatus Aminicenantes bacterium]|nr:amino acid permease [Candidatus Aminicenantes bacterium]
MSQESSQRGTGKKGSSPPQRGTSMKLSRELSLFSVTMIGVGAMIGAGIFVLTGIAAGVAGPAILIAFLLNGIVAFFTASAYAELGGSIPEAGGGYLWVKESLPQPSGFLSGWMSWMAHSVACSLYAIGFGAYFGEVLVEFKFDLLLPPVILKKILAVLVVIVFTSINYRGAKETGKAGNVVTVLKIMILLLFVLMGSKIIISEPQRFTNFFPFFSKGFIGILTAMGLTYIAFEGYEIIAQSGEEVKNPAKNVPKAIFLSLLIVVPIYIFVAFVALGVVNPGAMTPWAFLAAKKEVAMVEAARNISVWGSAVLLIGGLLSTISALNATIYSSSRVSFAMGRDHNLPPVFSRVHAKFKTPSGSLFVSSILIILMLLLLPIEDVASSADIMFLFLFIFVNVALIHIRRKKPQLLKGYKSPLFPLFPLIGIITQGVLIIVMFAYSPRSFFISLLWIGMGLSIYYGYAKHWEKKEVGPKILVEEKELAHRDFRIVLGIEHKQEVQPLMNLAVVIAKEKDGEIFVTHVIPLPPQTPLTAGKRFIEERREFLKVADDLGEKSKVPVSFNIRVARQVYHGLLDSVHENKGNVLILGSGEITARRRVLGSILDPIIQEAPCDVGILKIQGDGKIKRVLVPTAGGPNAKLALEWGSWIAKQNRGQLTLLSIALDEDRRKKAEGCLRETRNAILYDSQIVIEKVVCARDIVSAVLEESQNHDLILIGASKEGLWKRVRFGTIPEKLARRSPVSVLVVRKFEGGILSWIRRFLAG